ncbi:hypothetical protein CONLIGDRAFT_236520 [Coniochaeta ligniaria NRRL 30616]|uniref:Uncharacterized protein n=1 Tax=Coniochaeta ligniaria NRRL 30616 TaxID=1408157 RepID=A0A1J7IWL3_9PEZI|nr:hypothetical protein CONLIGDRAFT_236520 [Coniochaeta ligniaria NRRL 30616]
MSVTTSQPSTNSQAEPAPVTSDIAASQPPPAVTPAPVGDTGRPPAAFGVSAGPGPTKPGPPAPPPVPAPPSHGPAPAPSTPSQLPPAVHPPRHTVPPPTTFNQIAPQPQYYGQQSYPAPPAPPPPPSHWQQYPNLPPAQISYQRQPVQQQQGYQSQSSRPLIIDPPRKRSSMGLAVAMPPVHSVSPGFPSPTKDYPAAYPKFSDDLSRNTLAIKQSVPEAVRQAIRDNWEKCLLGSEFHQAFVVSTAIPCCRVAPVLVSLAYV